MMTCFQILSPLQSYSIFISSCLGRALASKHHFILNVHKGSTIIPLIFNYNLKFTNSECMVDSIMLSLLSTPIYLILHWGLNVNFPMLIQNFTLLFLNTAVRIQTQNCSSSPGTPCIFLCSPRRWLRGVQSSPLRLPSALFGC